MKNNIHACFGIVCCLPLVVWMRGEVWSHSLSDTLPLLIGIPLFLWMGWPWRLRESPPHIKGRYVALCAVGMLLGLAANLTLVFAVSWTTLLWLMLRTYFESSADRRLGQLMLLPLLSLPWILLDGQMLGWLFRISGAWSTEMLLSPFQMELVREGTLLSVGDVRISVEEGCSGLKSLQSMLLVGAVMAYVMLGESSRFWWHPPIVVAVAWTANTARILSTTLIAVYISPSYVSGAFHQWEGLLVLTLTFLLCGFAFRRLQRRGSPPARGVRDVNELSAACAIDEEFPDGRAWVSKTGLVVLFFCTAHSLDLLQGWQTSPLDRWAWIALLIWLSPLAIIRILDEKHEYVMRESVSFYAMAVALTLLGQIGSLNVLQHCGLLLAVTGLLRSSWRTAVWLVSGVSWMPVFGWVVQQHDYLLELRLALASIGAVLMLAPHAHLPHEPERVLRIKRHLLVAGLVAASLLGFVWSFVPLAGAELRMLQMPLEGEGFRSWPVPIKREEELLLGTGLAARRMYQFSGDTVLLSVVDGTMNRHAVHDPAYCFRGSGYRVEESRRIEVDGGVARTLTLTKNGDRFEIAYWFSNGRRRHCSVLSYWWQTTLRRVSLGLSGPEPVLVILQTDRPIDRRLLQDTYQGVFLSV